MRFCQSLREGWKECKKRILRIRFPPILWYHPSCGRLPSSEARPPVGQATPPPLGFTHAHACPPLQPLPVELLVLLWLRLPYVAPLSPPFRDGGTLDWLVCCHRPDRRRWSARASSGATRREDLTTAATEWASGGCTSMEATLRRDLLEHRTLYKLWGPLRAPPKHPSPHKDTVRTARVEMHGHHMSVSVLFRFYCVMYVTERCGVPLSNLSRRPC